MKILERRYFNNGYGCQCCRNDWQETVWIDADDKIPFDRLLKEQAEVFNENCREGGLVGLVYEVSGDIMYGIVPYIYRAGWDLKATFNGTETPIKGCSWVSNQSLHKTPDEILEEYNKLSNQ